MNRPVLTPNEREILADWKFWLGIIIGTGVALFILFGVGAAVGCTLMTGGMAL
jgi:hypothetical protein